MAYERAKLRKTANKKSSLTEKIDEAAKRYIILFKSGYNGLFPDNFYARTLRQSLLQYKLRYSPIGIVSMFFSVLILLSIVF